MRIEAILAFFGLLMAACSDPSEAAMMDCSELTCGENQVCVVDTYETCTDACDTGDDVGCVCELVDEPRCDCAPTADRASDGTCTVVPTGYTQFTTTTADYSRGTFSITDLTGVTACSMADSVSAKPIAAGSQILIGAFTSVIEPCELPSVNDRDLPRGCAWFRSWDAGGNVIQRDVAVGGAVRVAGLRDSEAGFYTQDYEIELRFSSGATYVNRITFDLDPDYSPQCTDQ